MSYEAIAIALVGSVFLLYKLADNIEFFMFDSKYNIAKHLLTLVAMWLTLPIINLCIVIEQSHPVDYPIHNTLAGVYSAMMYSFIFITAMYLLGIMWLSWKMMSEAGQR